ncbi:MAG: Co2+/Mg2+ efflux protein ApaG [Bacteriovoracaceae bacterium]|nr:Co2+/Mg2+ efflux protein ApaG [Bacteriovoracaceae bacterium]
MEDTTYTNTSHGFEIKVETNFDFQKSNPLRFHYLFKYKITITNLSEKTAQLISRKWTIIDANEKVDLVEGPGVVGNQPLFRPKEKFTYQSFCPLSTMNGRMYGQYFMKDEEGEFFAIETPVFFFKIPEELLNP